MTNHQNSSVPVKPRTDDELRLRILFGTFGNAVDYLGEGWAGPNATYTWSLGHQTTLSFPRINVQKDFRLIFRARPLYAPQKLERQRLIVFLNWQFVGYFVFEGDAEQTACVILPWKILSGLAVTTVTFRVPDATSPLALGIGQDIQTLGMAFSELLIENADSPPPDGAIGAESKFAPELRDFTERQAEKSALIRRFEGLGHDCEFGMVQRGFDIHTIGLLKFASITAAGVAELLEGGLEKVGSSSSLTIDVAGDGEMLIRDQDLGFMMHSFNYSGAGLDQDELLAREEKRLPRVAQKLREEVQAGDKIFVFVDPGNSEREVMRMLAALRENGPNTLLWLRKASDENPAGLVQRSLAGLLLGYIPERPPRVPGPGFADPDLDVWFTVCERAIHLRDADQIGAINE